MKPRYPNDRGDLMARIVNADISQGYPMEFIISSPDIDHPRIEVYNVPAIGSHEEPEYFMATDDGLLVKFAKTGIPTSMHKLSKKRNGKETLETILEMDPQGTYHLFRNTLPANGVVDNPSLTDMQILEQLINYSYSKAITASESVKDKASKEFGVLTYNAIVARFHVLNTMRSPGQIIPDQTPRTIFVKAGEGCGKGCGYCDLASVPFKVYSTSEYKQHLETVRSALGSRGKTMNELFINISDLVRIDEAYNRGETDLTALKALELARKYFPWVEKIASFVDARTAIKAYERDPNYFNKLYGGGRLLNRLYLGIETGDDSGSILVDKPILAKDKLKAARIIQEAGILLKIIIQVGLLGEYFIPKDKPVESRYKVHWTKAQDATIDLVNQIGAYRIMISETMPDRNKKMEYLEEIGRVIQYANRRRGIQKETERLYSKLKIDPERQRIEPGYHEFLDSQTTGKLVVSHNKLSIS